MHGLQSVFRNASLAVLKFEPRSFHSRPTFGLITYLVKLPRELLMNDRSRLFRKGVPISVPSLKRLLSLSLLLQGKATSLSLAQEQSSPQHVVACQVVPLDLLSLWQNIIQHPTHPYTYAVT